MNLEDIIKNLPPELQEKVRACSSIDELLALSTEKKIPLPEEALEAIAGGAGAGTKNCGKVKCPSCGSTKIKTLSVTNRELGWEYVYKCEKCGRVFEKFYYYEH